MVFGLTEAEVDDAIWLGQDSDGDGLTNRAELAAGTKPRRAHSLLAIKGVTADTDNVYLTLPTVIAKQYEIQSTSDAGAFGNWTNFQPAVQQTGDGLSQANLLAELSQSMNAFQTAMHRIGVQYGF